MRQAKSRSANRSQRRDNRKPDHAALLHAAQQQEITKRPVRRSKVSIKPLTDAQASYDNSIKANIITFGIGPAGTGKTFVAANRMAEMLDKGEIEKLIITRPAVEAGESLGFLPGEAEEKWAPYFAPVRIELERFFGSGQLEYMIKNGIVEAAPLAYLRGHTFKNCGVLFDEAQNCTKNQMKMFLTRIGEDSRVIIDGDPKQCDLGKGMESGLIDAMKRLRHIKSVGVVRFTTDDIVRSGICREIVCAYDDDLPLDEVAITLEESMFGLYKTLREDAPGLCRSLTVSADLSFIVHPVSSAL